MKCHRKVWGQNYAIFDRMRSDYNKKHWKSSSPYYIRWKMCARAHNLIRYSKYIKWKNTLPKEIQSQTHFYEFLT